MNLTPSPVSLQRPGRLWLLALLFCAEVLALAVAYQFFAVIECHATDLNGVCRFLRSLVARAVVMFAAFGLLLWARPLALSAFRRSVEGQGAALVWRLLHVLGVLLLISPLAFAPGGNIGAVFDLAVWPLLLGSVLAAVGGLFWLAPPQAWARLLAQDHFAPVITLALAAVLPDLADMALPLWDWQGLTRLTFDAVHLFLGLFASDIRVDAPGYIIGFPQFSVHIARQCSGVEGVALVTGFTVLYAFIFRDTVRFPHFWLVVLPLAIILSWLLNVVRVGGLILIGQYVSPDLAVNGFHSYAGWVFFTLLALAIVWGVQAVPWLHRARMSDPTTAGRLTEDPLAGALLPFAIFMGVSLLTHALFPHPELGYPLRAMALGLAIWVFRGFYRQFEWRVDPLAVALGVLVGLGWLWFDQADARAGMDLARALGGLSGWMLAIWIVTRLIGTVLLVPLVEEMFFRGYLLARLDGPAPWRRLLAVAVSSAAFAALHGRWLAAGVAGVIFALVMLRRGRVADAVIAHIAANLVVAAWAVATSDFARI